MLICSCDLTVNAVSRSADAGELVINGNFIRALFLLRTFLPSVIYNGEKGQSGTDFLDFSKNMKIFAKAVPFTVFVPL